MLLPLEVADAVRRNWRPGLPIPATRSSVISIAGA